MRLEQLALQAQLVQQGLLEHLEQQVLLARLVLLAPQVLLVLQVQQELQAQQVPPVRRVLPALRVLRVLLEPLAPQDRPVQLDLLELLGPQALQV